MAAELDGDSRTPVPAEDWPAPELITLDEAGTSLSVHTAGPPRGPAVVLCHGFPDLAYGWRHQLPALAQAGYRAVAPDQRGYGGSSRPPSSEAYGLGNLCGDLVHLLDRLDIDDAVFVGHDWGGLVAWGMAVLHPGRCRGVVGLCTPYLPFPTTTLLRHLFPDPERMYMLWFQEPGVAEAVLDPRADLVFERLFGPGLDPAAAVAHMTGPDGLPDANPFRRLDDLPIPAASVLTPSERAHYVDVFSRTGFAGGIGWYRNLDANAHLHPEVGTRPLDLPCLMICAEWDPALPPALAEHMDGLCSDLEVHTLPRVGHWLPQEAPEDVNSLLLDWLRRRFPPTTGN